jgi:hypothetical protein
VAIAGVFSNNVYMSCYDRSAKHLLCFPRGIHSIKVNFITICTAYYNFQSSGCEDVVQCQSHPL